MVWLVPVGVFVQETQVKPRPEKHSPDVGPEESAPYAQDRKE